MAQMGLHLPKPDDLIAQMALGRTTAIDEFVRCEAGEYDFRIINVGVRVALLWHEEMTELTEDLLPRASCGAVMSKRRKALGLKLTVGA